MARPHQVGGKGETVRQCLSVSVMVLLLVVAAGFAQQQVAETTPPAAIPVASQAKVECSGVIADDYIPKDVVLSGGQDNDHLQPLRQFGTGDVVYLRLNGGASVAVGSEYRLVRRPKEQFRTTWYSGQQQWWSSYNVGLLYEDVGLVKVKQLTDNGAVAEVTLACRSIYPGDVAIPYQARPIPEYVPTAHWDQYAPANGKLDGLIVAAGEDTLMLGTGSIAYINLGEDDGARPGQRYRIFRTFKDRAWALAPPETPRETTGELVILTTAKKGSVGIVVNSIREIGLRDGVELE
jgi:hypothetical protein